MDRPPKRARVDSGDDSNDSLPAGNWHNHDISPSSGTCVCNVCSRNRHTKLWFSDGSVILNVQRTLFKVHKTMLSTYSTVMADMFSLPEAGPANPPMIEGCPVVVMFDDAEEFADLLSVMYEPQ